MESHGHPPIAPSNKKAKTKKAADPNETSKLLAAKISQLESDAAGEKDQEAEIGKWQNFFGLSTAPADHTASQSMKVCFYSSLPRVGKLA